MPRMVCLGKWTVLSPELLTHTVDGGWVVTSMTPWAISVRFCMALRRSFWREHRPVAGVETWKVIYAIGGAVTVFTSGILHDVVRSFTAHAVSQLASKAALAENCLAARRVVVVA